MDSNRISLAIFGNQLSNSGFQPLYWINNPPQQLENIVPAGMDDSLFFLTLQQLPEHTQLTLTSCRVSSYQSARPGVLKMAVAIPRGYRPANGKSIHDVLMHIYDVFQQTCMTPRDEHAATFNFCEKLPPASTFADIVNNYALEPAPDQLSELGTVGDVPLLIDAHQNDSTASAHPSRRTTLQIFLLALFLGLTLGALAAWLLKPTGSKAVTEEEQSITAVEEEDEDEAEMPMTLEEPIDDYELYGNDDDIVPPPEPTTTTRRRASQTDTLPWRPDDYQQHRNAKQSEPQPKQQTDTNGNKESKYQ